MKIKKIKYSNNKILKLQTLKLYAKSIKNNDKNQLSHIQAHLNKISNIVYKYSKANKKILFLGFPIKFKKSLKNTKHRMIPEFVSFNGILTNPMFFNKIKKIKNYSLPTLKLILKIKKPDLVIIYNKNNKSKAIQESYIARIPTITFNDKLNFDNKTDYQSLGNYKLLNEKAKSQNFILSFLTSTLNRAKI